MSHELLKLKRTLVWPVLLSSPFVVGLLGWGVARGPEPVAWGDFLSNGLMLWALLMMPLVVSLVVAQVVAVEHTTGSWRYALTLPWPRTVLYARKITVVLSLTLLANVLLVPVLLLVGHALLPNLTGAPDVAPLLLATLKIWGGSLALTAVAYWLALRFTSFLAPSGAGAAATVMGFVLINSEYGRWWPWALGALAVAPAEHAVPTAQLLAYSGLVALAVLALALFDFSRRDR